MSIYLNFIIQNHENSARQHSVSLTKYDAFCTFRHALKNRCIEVKNHEWYGKKWYMYGKIYLSSSVLSLDYC